MALAGMLGLLVLASLTLVDVIKREAGYGSFPGATEYAEVLLCAVVFLGMLPAETTRVHVRTPLLVDRLRPRSATIARCAGLAVAVAILAWTVAVTFEGGLESMRSNEVRFGTKEVPLWPFRLLIPVCLGALAMRLLLDLIERLTTLFPATKSHSRSNDEAQR